MKDAHPPVLILGGAREARDLSEALGRAAHLHLWHPERVPGRAAAGETVGKTAPVGRARLVIDACHPCDVEGALRAWRLAQGAGLPLFRLERPAWRAGPRDLWTEVPDEERAARHVPAGARVFAALGRAGLSALRGCREVYFLNRTIGGAPLGVAGLRGRNLRGHAPFTVDEELAILRRHRISLLLVRNAGGTGGWPKLAAARALGLPVLMVARPRKPGARTVRSLPELMERITPWL